MKTAFLPRAFAVLSFCAALSSFAVGAAVRPTYHLAAKWKLAGDSYWDYLTVDGKANRLYITRDTRIQVLDTRTGALVKEIKGFEDVHGVALVPKLGCGFATNGGGNSVVVFNLKTLAVVGHPIRVSEGPDGIIYEPMTGEIFALNGDSKSASVIDAASKKVVATIALGSNPESAAVDGKGNVFVNLEGSSKLAQIDAKTRKVVHVWPLAPGQEPTGLAYDAKSGRLFAGCANKLMMVVDAKTGKIVAPVPIGAGVDAGAFDAGLGWAFSPNGRDGTLSVVGSKGGKPAVLATIATHKGARTMALDAATHTIYVVAADYKVTPPGVKAPRWPEMVPGSAVVMKYELGAAK